MIREKEDLLIEELVEQVSQSDNPLVAVFEIDDFLTSAKVLSIVEGISLEEAIVKRVSSDGTIKRVKDRKTRQRQAFQTTGLSKSERRRIAKKAARTLRQRPGVVKKATKKRKRAMTKRASMGIRYGQ